MSNLRLSAEDQRHVDAYLEYHALVGGTDGGRLLSASEYEAIREKAAAAADDPLRCAWVCAATGLQCRLVGPFSRCMCDHSFREHDILQTRQQQRGEELQVKCKVPRCRCPHYTFIPVQGSADIRCRCKHSYRDHDPGVRRCLRCNPSKGSSSKGPSKQPGPSAAAKRAAALKAPEGCEGFDPPTRCACGSAYGLHETRFWFDSETDAPGDRRIAGRGHSASKTVLPMGGLTGLVDLAEGIDRLSIYSDDPQAFLQQAVGMNTETATVNRCGGQQKQQQQGTVDCLSLLYTPLRFS